MRRRVAQVDGARVTRERSQSLGMGHTCDHDSAVWCNIASLLELDGHCAGGRILPVDGQRLTNGDLKGTFTSRYDNGVLFRLSSSQSGAKSKDKSSPGAHDDGNRMKSWNRSN